MQNMLTEKIKNLTIYWEYLSLYHSCKLDIFDHVKNLSPSKQKLQKLCKADNQFFTKLLDYLFHEKYLKLIGNKIYLTKKGETLTDEHPSLFKFLILNWWDLHLNSWQSMDISIHKGKSSFEFQYKKKFFEYISQDKKKLKIYQKAMYYYARKDYSTLLKKYDFSPFQKITDLGGGLGYIIQILTNQFPNKDCILFESSSVIQLLDKDIKTREGNFFKDSLPYSDIFILSRILHDWNDSKCLEILKNTKKYLNKNGKIMVIEILQDFNKTYLLNLNMFLLCGSKERYLKDYNLLFKKMNFKLEKLIPLNNLYSILIYS
jgi:hypothetical protein